MPDRFAPPAEPMEEVRRELQGVAALLRDQSSLLNMLLNRPDPVPSLPQVNVTAPEVHVPLEPLQEQMQHIVDRFGSLAEVLENPSPSGTPQVEVLNEVDLSPLLTESERTREAIESLRKWLDDRNSGQRSHFDGRMRNAQGLIDSSNPLPVTSGNGQTAPVEVVQWTNGVDGAVPSGASVTIDPVLNTEPNVLDSGWIDVQSYSGKSIVNFVGDAAVEVYLMNASDDAGNHIVGNGAPTFVTSGLTFSPSQLSALYPDRYFRVVVVNTSGSPLTDYSLRAVAAPESTDGVTTAIDASVFGFFPARITRSVSVGRQPDGDYVNAPATGLAADVDGNAIQTSTPLGAGATWQSGWVETDGWDEVEVTVAADEVSATNGIVIEFSEDVNTATPLPRGVPARRTLTAADAAQGGTSFRLPPRLDGFRISYTNGGVAQSTFVLTVTLRADTTAPPRAPLAGDLGDTSEALTSRSAIVAPDTADVEGWGNVGRTQGTNGEYGLDVYVVGNEPVEPKSATTAQYGSHTATGSATRLDTSPLSGQRTISVINADNNTTAYLGFNSSVTSNSGYPLFASGGSVWEGAVTSDVEIWVITASSTASLRWTEVA